MKLLYRCLPEPLHVSDESAHPNAEEAAALPGVLQFFGYIVAAICLALLEAIYDRIVSWGASIVFLAAVVAVLFAARLLAG